MRDTHSFLHSYRISELGKGHELKRMTKFKRADNEEKLGHVCYKMSSRGKRSKKGKRKGKQETELVPVQELEEPKEMEDEVPGEVFTA